MFAISATLLRGGYFTEQLPAILRAIAGADAGHKNRPVDFDLPDRKPVVGTNPEPATGTAAEDVCFATVLCIR